MSFNKKFFATGGIVASSEAVCNTDSKYAFGADSSFTSNVATYQLDGNANDTTGNYNGTASNVTYTTGYIDNSAVFNGSATSIRSKITTSGLATYNNFSISCWVNPDTVSSSSLVMGTSDSYGTQTGFGLFFGFPNSGDLTWRVSNGSSTVDLAATGLSTGTWYHVVITQNVGNNEKKIYVNGVLEDSSTSSINVIGQGYSLILGGYQNFNNTPYDGKLDQVRIFDRTINASEVATLYAETTSTASSTNPLNEGQGVALYNLDYDASDAGGLYDGTPTDVTFGVGGQINYGARFNGSSSKIILPTLSSDFVGANPRSVSAWVKITSTPSGTLTIFNSGATATLQAFGVFIGTSRQIIISYYNRNWETSETISLDTWTHIVFTYNGGAVETSSNSKVYINNTLATLGNTTGSATGSANTSNTNHAIGVFATTSTLFFNGSIDQVRIFSSVLTDDQVSTLYAETACVYTCTTDTINHPTSNVAYYKLDNSAEDETGSYDGTENNISYTFGRFGQAADFSGSISYINTGYTRSGNEFAISMWVYASDTGLRQYLFADHNSPGATVTMSVACFIDTSDNINIKLGDGSSSQASIQTSFSSYYGKWTHIVLSIASDGKTSTLYLDNNQITGTTVSNVYQTGLNPIGLGHWGGSPSSANEFTGLMDQVRIFSSALDSDQVTQLYEEKPCADTSNFKTVLYEGTGATQYISNVGMDLETDGGLVWVKKRDTAINAVIFDSVRTVGANKELTPSENYAEGGGNSGTYGYINSFDTNGFTVKAGSTNGNLTNASGGDYVSWVWLGGGEAQTLTNTGNVNSDVSVNNEAGFSIVKASYGANGSGTGYQKTVKHGLTTPPEIIIAKRTDSSSTWYVFEDTTGSLLGSDNHLHLDTTAAKDSDTTFSIQSSDTFKTGFSTGAYDIIAYCFHSVAGYSKIGKYSGNGNTNGTEVTTDFEPSFLLIKNINNTKSWRILDNRRGFNSSSGNVHKHLAPDLSSAENSDTTDRVRFISTGFKLITASASFNESGTDNFLYMAFK